MSTLILAEISKYLWVSVIKKAYKNHALGLFINYVTQLRKGEGCFGVTSGHKVWA